VVDGDGVRHRPPNRLALLRAVEQEPLLGRSFALSSSLLRAKSSSRLGGSVMIALFVQTLLLMTAAYFLGAALACLLRRSFSAPAQTEPALARPVEPLPEMQRPAAGSARFGLGGEAGLSPLPRPAAPSAHLVVPPDRLAVPISEPAEAQDLTRISLIDRELEVRLNKLGIRRYAQVAAWMRPEVQRVSKALGLGGRISKENWIEQAQVLARGGVTHYALRAVQGEIANAAPTSDEGEPRALAPAAEAPRASTDGAAAVAAMVTVAPTQPNLATPRVAERAAFAPEAEKEPTASAATPPLVEPIRPAAPATHDNLQRISGIDAEIETLLFAQGVSRYSQIALWSPIDVARLDALLGTRGRIGRENWIEQAQILSRGGDTAFSRDHDRRAGGKVDTPAVRTTAR